MSKPKEESLVPLQIIRTETVFSKFPIHNLSKQKKTSIQISKKNEQGQASLYWKVSPHSEYGHPGELAYKIDTLVINKRIDELGKPLPEMFRLGTRNEIHEELGSSTKNKNTANIEKALRQNAGASISTDFKHKGKDGTEQRIEAQFTRYGIILTGETLPNGEKADAVYIILNEPYRGVLNNAPARPLNYDYLKKLKPTAQRFYEIISYRIFAAINHNHDRAKLLYSEYCMFSAQPRYYDYGHFKKQMYKVHKPHLESGYIEKAEYQKITDESGKTDWAIYYTPGPKAKAEYRAFNSKRLFEDEIIDIGKEKPNKEKKHREKEKRSSSNKQVNNEAVASPPTEASRALASGDDLQLVQYFHKLSRGIENYQPYHSSKEKKQARELLSIYGLEKARFIVDFAVAEAKKTSFRMRTFGAALQYVSDAIAEYERRERELERKRNKESVERQQQEQYTEARLQVLAPDQYSVLYEEAKKQVLADVPTLVAYQEEPMVQSMIKEEMVRVLDRQAKQRSGQ